MKHLTHGRPRHLVAEKEGRRGSLVDLAPEKPESPEKKGWLANPYWQIGLATVTSVGIFYNTIGLIPVVAATYWSFYNRNIDRRMLISPDPVEVFDSNKRGIRKDVARVVSPLDDQSWERHAPSASANR